MNSEVFRNILCAQIQPNAAKLIGRHFIQQMDNDPKHKAKATQEFIKAKKWNILEWPSGSRGSRDDSWSTRQGWRFVLSEGIWKPLSPMNNPRTNHASASLNGEIYVIGGTLQVAVEVECYDPYSGKWSSVSPAQKYVSNFSAVGCGGKLYVVGSCAIKYNALTLQCYNPSTEP
ncbi:unnamed protein product [Ranitomeya imitator]|uniref:Uncharacterized protein n=1 Tax=Ranitomeya imitator TaxID=111125 RepID=A0ABN9KRT0_9NEOB|nr:unnamed protein product [Ranitomeya imitator]